MKNENKITILDRESFPLLLDLLSKKGYELYGPTIDNDSLIYDRIKTTEDLPIGWKDNQGPGQYRLEKSNKKTIFAYTVGFQSWKKILHPAHERLWDATLEGKGFAIHTPGDDISPKALLGVRSCELEALKIHDKILMEGPHTDSHYQHRRKNIFIVAVNCTQPGGTCFCASMNTGPKAQSAFDLSLTEIMEADKHYFTVAAGSEIGIEILQGLPVRDASHEEIAIADKAMERSVKKMGRTLKTKGLKELLLENFDNPHWEKISERCLTCGNCTLVCPTCFCVNVEDTTDLSGQKAERWNHWDSCFIKDFSYIHGGSIRISAASRYRQWLMHKLAYWVDQFGTFGCVGCGRCITWCPAGIDITEEADAIIKNV
ncbi:MAG: 4Fe-4S dicluster domain-containing protein [Candidatus Zixiibacteriota bacterium]